MICLSLGLILVASAMSLLRAGTQSAQKGGGGNMNMNFGNVAVGSSASQTASVTNNTKRNVTITQIQSSGAPFSVNGMALPQTIPPGQSLAVTGQFAPASTGVFNGSITLTESSGQQPAISLTGTGTAPSLTLTPSSLSFGNILVGQQSSLSVLATNNGTSAVTITSDSVTGVGFTVANLSLPLTLNPNQAVSFSVDFDPNAAGNFTGTVSLTSNAAGSPTIESLSGSGLHAVTLTWMASTSPGVTGYDIYRGSVSGGPYTAITTSPIAGTTYTDTSVTAGLTYFLCCDSDWVRRRDERLFESGPGQCSVAIDRSFPGEALVRPAQGMARNDAGLRISQCRSRVCLVDLLEKGQELLAAMRAWQHWRIVDQRSF